MEDLLMKLELFYFAMNIPLRLYDAENNLLYSYMLESQTMPEFLAFSKYESELLFISQKTNYQTNDINEHYYSFGFCFKGLYFKLIVGPTTDYVFNRAYLLKIINEKKLRIIHFDVLNSYFNSLPKYTSEALRRTEPLLRHLLCGSKFNLKTNLQRYDIHDEKKETDTNIKGNQRYHHSINKDELVFDALKSGDRDRLFTLLYTPADGPEGILCKENPIRSYKNLFIVTVGHATKAAIDGGVDSESAYTLSDTLIQEVENINIYEDITELFISMFNSFLELVQKNNKHKYTNPVYKTIEHINKHYDSKLTVGELADSVHLSEGHLFKLFKNETNMSIKSYIIQKRVMEVKKLLKYTNYDISTICEMTGFSDQSYMTNQFRKIVMTTPKKYRDLR